MNFRRKKALGFLGAGSHAKEMRAMFATRVKVEFMAVQPEFITPSSITISVDTQGKFIHAAVITAVGSVGVRRELVNRWAGSNFISLCSDDAKVLGDLDIEGRGVFIAAGAVISTGVELGNHAHVNIGATISHDCELGHFSTLSPGVSLGGGVTLGDGVFVGIGATITDRVYVCPGAFIGAGTVVTRNIDTPGTYVGSPARKISDIESWDRLIS